MINKTRRFIVLFYSVLLLGTSVSAQKTLTMKIADMPLMFKEDFKVIGNPLIVKTRLGNAVHFDGIDDGYFLDFNSLKGMKAFTIEVVFKPDGDGYKSPRFMHLGETSGKRVMFETRINQNGEWYFDAHFNAGENKSLTLIDSTKTHYSDQWYTLTVVAANDSMTSYVNGAKELSGKIEFAPFDSGKASFGFRQNYSSWFKGTIYMIRISPSFLKRHQFLKLHNELN